MGYVLVFFILGAILFWALYVATKNLAVSILCSLGGFVLAVTVIGIGMFSDITDTEIWNGVVTEKEKDEVSCSHSYDCNCKNKTTCTGSGKDRSCSTTNVCDTCYTHSHDYDWYINTTIGKYTIDRIDSQGKNTPPRWDAAKVGDPASKTHTYVNYIKGARANVINREGTKITYPMPTYPSGVYDYYKLDRAVNVDSVVTTKPWSDALSEILKTLGTAKQVNVVLVFTKNPEEYAEQLNAAWLGGKKNDVVVVVGTSDGKTTDWVKVLSWTKREDLKVELRDALMDTPLSPEPFVQVIATHLKEKFDRRRMREFEYLQYEITPSTTAVTLSIIFFLLPVLGFGIYTVQQKRVRKSYKKGF